MIIIRLGVVLLGNLYDFLDNLLDDLHLRDLEYLLNDLERPLSLNKYVNTMTAQDRPGPLALPTPATAPQEL